ncbi:SRPBCC family protein [Pedococcus sp. 5OH_020]|uniref:SRPBCC family protein n=1 Tax=Pedococcus sp. 5OH_020 TaxID=2989814 RepID=UPI0022E9CB4C|nr:SRPBCC domain-containing protein [Pedococcus sp. 5OH_020]
MPEHVLNFTRVFDAPRDLVFRCMVEPHHLTRFWGPIGTSTPLDQISVDARPGGTFATVMVNDSDGSRYATSATYVEVRAPERLSWLEGHSGMAVTVTFTDLGDNRTQVDIEQSNVPEQLLDPRAQAGFLTSLDRFASHLATLTVAQR